jgi:hypothetical protein
MTLLALHHKFREFPTSSSFDSFVSRIKTKAAIVLGFGLQSERISALFAENLPPTESSP